MEMKLLVEESNRAFKALGEAKFGILKSEQKSLIFKRSLYAQKDIEAGEVFTTENLKVIRPGYGLEPKYFDIVLGKTAKIKIIKGQPITWEILL